MSAIRHDPEEFVRLPYDEQYTRMHNAASFADIPNEQMPWDSMTRSRVKLDLALRALAGQDIYAYRPAHQPDYVIWDRQPDPAQEARFSPRDWARAHGYDVGSEEADDAANH